MGESLDVLLIGGSGFLGGHAARAFRAAGHRVTILTRGTRPPHPDTQTLVGDRDDPRSLAAALEGRHFDLTVDFLVFDATDVERLLLVPYATLGRYVMISTGQVYLVTQGATAPFIEEQGELAVSPEPEPQTHAHRNWVYGVGKRRAERLLLGLRATHGVRATAIRAPILQGEHDGSLRLWAYLERMLDGGPILLPDGGNQPIRHLDAADLARALVWLADHETPRHMVYNFAQPDILTFRGLMERVAAMAGITPRFVEVSWSEMREAGLDEACSPYASGWSSVLDPSRMAIEWGVTGRPSAEFLPRVVSWHLENRPATSHAGYAQRGRERDLASRAGVGRA